MRTVGEIAIGVLFAIGAVFNGVYTLRNGTEFYRSFVEGAWLAPARDIVEKVVIPNATMVTIAVVIFEAAAAVAILSRGDLVQPALFAGAAFAVVAAAASNAGGTLGNLLLAAVMIVLAVGR